jgi:hypothetical protein
MAGCGSPEAWPNGATWRMGTTRALDGRGTAVATELPRRPWRSSAFARGRREAGRERGREGASERGSKLGIHFRRAQRRDSGIPRGSNGGHALCMAATHGTRRPLRHSSEHVAGSDMGKVERRFGPLLGRIRHWAINEICSPRPALRFLFKVPSHLSFVTVDN